MTDAHGQVTSIGARALDAIERRVARGDRSAFADLYDVLAPRVYADLADAVGTVRAGSMTSALLVDAWQRAARIRAEHASISAWVLAQTGRLAAAIAPTELPRGA